VVLRTTVPTWLERTAPETQMEAFLIQVGAPEDKMPAFSAFALIAKGVKVGGSIIGSLREIRV